MIFAFRKSINISRKKQCIKINSAKKNDLILSMAMNPPCLLRQ